MTCVITTALVFSLATCCFLVTAESTVYDLTEFETVNLPLWLEQFSLGGPGNYSYLPGPPTLVHPISPHRPPHPYSPSDVAHVLCFTGRLNLSTEEQQAWADHINSFQFKEGQKIIDDRDFAGFFNNQDK